MMYMQEEIKAMQVNLSAIRGELQRLKWVFEQL